MQHHIPERQLRSAVFVDFDNVYLGLKKMDAAAAESFATDPGRLLSSLEIGQNGDGPFRRRFLMKACYLNPQTFRRYRSYFVGAGFRVIDCPSLTQRGKSAADIHVVLDVLDALDHRTTFDEFVICSADADFTPLFVKLRAHDRRTVMIAAGPAAAAYQAVCDETLGAIQLAEVFAPVQGAIAPAAESADVRPSSPLDGSTSGAGQGASLSPAPRKLGREDVGEAVRGVREAVAAAGGALAGASAAQAAIRVVPDIAAAAWGGAGSFAEFVAREISGLKVVRTESGGWVIDLELRDRAAERGVPLGRTAANFVVQGLIYAGFDPRTTDGGPRELAEHWRDSLVVLCERAGLELGEQDRRDLDLWVLGCL
jgi:hypothetical protein